MTVDKIYQSLLLAGLCFHGYQQLSYIVLSRLSPVSHSVGNSCKRVAVIVASLIWFRNPISVQNAVGETRLSPHLTAGSFFLSPFVHPLPSICSSYLGTSLALTGVFLYSQAKRIYDKKGGKKASE